MIPIPQKAKSKAISSRYDYWWKSGWWIVLPLLVLTFLSQHHIFFWDTVQFAGKHPQWFYQYQFEYLLLPEGIDSGHPPVFGWYLALIWTVFGKSLVTSHWAMFPFLLGIVWQGIRTARFWLPGLPPVWLLLVFWVEPVLLGQSVLVSPDIALIFFFLLSLNSSWAGQRSMLALALLGLTAISTRGMMIVAAIGFYELILHWGQLRSWTGKSWWSWLWPYLPGAFFSLAYLWAHYQHSGWIGYHADSPWAYGFQRVDLNGLFHNLALFGWRWLDYGRLFVWGVFLYLLIRYRRQLMSTTGRAGTRINKSVLPLDTSISKIAPFPFPLFLLLIILTVFLSYSFLSYRSLHAHRYLLPVFLLFSLCVLVLVDRLVKPARKPVFLLLMILGLAGGNLWVYPERIAQGWDATLAHWPYYTLREQMLAYLDEHDLPIESVGTAFPDIGPLDDRDLSGRQTGFAAKDLEVQAYILYSNIMNDFTDAEIDRLYQDWEEVVRFQRRGVFMALYRRPD